MFASLNVLKELQKHYENNPKDPLKGIIWHTQGSGKTALTYHLTKLIKDFFSPLGKKTKFYFIVDRLDLLEQAKNEFLKRGFQAHEAEDKEDLSQKLKSSSVFENPQGNDEIIVVNIQKFKAPNEDPFNSAPKEIISKTELQESIQNSHDLQRVFIIDEAHRSYDPKGCFYANLIECDKTAIKIALTGTPLLEDNAQDKATKKTFGNYLHTYSYTESIKDAHTLTLQLEIIEKSYKKSIIPNKKIYFEFLYYLLKYHKDNISNIGGGTTFKEVSGATLGLFKVKIPPTYYEQQKIARTLSILDQKIENNHKINELLHTLAYKIYEYYFKYKPKNAKLEQIIIENPKSSIMVKNAQKTQDKYPFFTSGDNILSYPKAIIDGRNCFLNTGGNAGIKFYVGKASYSTDTWCICANEFSDYLYLLLSSIKTHINQSFFQGTSLKHLQKNLLKKYPIYMPSAHEIKKFNQIIMPLLTLISINTRTSKKLEQIRDFLLPLLLKQQVKPQ